MKENKSPNKYRAFREKHPKLHIANAFVSLFGPIALLGIIVLVFKEYNGRETFGIYSVAGSFILAIGLVLLVATDYDKDIFWHFTVYPVILGLLITIANLIAYYTSVGLMFGEKLLEFQLCCYLVAFISGVEYFGSRKAINDRIMIITRLKQDDIDDRKEGFWNYIWYNRIHKEFGLGCMYYVNIFTTTSLFLFFVCTVFLVFVKSVNVCFCLGIISTLLVIVCLLHLVVMAVKRKKSYSPSKKGRGLLSRIPYFYDWGGILMEFLMIYILYGAYTSL